MARKNPADLVPPRSGTDTETKTRTDTETKTRTDTETKTRTDTETKIEIGIDHEVAVGHTIEEIEAEMPSATATIVYMVSPETIASEIDVDLPQEVEAEIEIDIKRKKIPKRKKVVKMKRKEEGSAETTRCHALGLGLLVATTVS